MGSSHKLMGSSNLLVSVCRLGYTGRCPGGFLFGSPALEGGQAQYVRVPKAGGTLFNLSNPSTWSSALPSDVKQTALSTISDSSLVLLADILPTGVFAALQTINHPKVAPMITGKPWPLCFSQEEVSANEVGLTDLDRILTIAIIGLGPVGVCATVSMLDILATRNIPFRMVAIDPIQSRREKMKAVYNTIDSTGKGTGEFTVLSIDEAKIRVQEWTNGVGATAVLEVGFWRSPGFASVHRAVGRWKHKCYESWVRTCAGFWRHCIRGRTWYTTPPCNWPPTV